MSVYKKLSLLFLVILFSSCSRQLPTLDHVDTEVWKHDRNACNGDRTSMMKSISDQREKLKKLSEMDLVDLLGRPDENQLLDRNQKFFKYYLEPGPNCDNPKVDAKKLVLRFNAMGLAKEVMIR